MYRRKKAPKPLETGVERVMKGEGRLCNYHGTPQNIGQMEQATACGG